MIIVAGTIEVEPGEREAFLASRADVVRRSRAEEGCLDYAFCADPLEPSRVVLFERWASKEALDAHVAVLRSDPAPGPEETRPRSSDVAVYEVGGVHPLGG